MNKSKIYVAAVLAMLLVSCSPKGAGDADRGGATAADIEAAKMQGREEARRFVSRQWKDSLELHNQLLEVSAVRSRYIEQKRQQECDVFDSVFISTVRAVRPGLAAQIESQRPH